MHVNDINNIVCTIKKTTVFQFTYTLLSQYEFLYSSLVKIYSHPPLQVSLVFMQLSVMGAASEVIVL